MPVVSCTPGTLISTPTGQQNDTTSPFSRDLNFCLPQSKLGAKHTFKVQLNRLANKKEVVNRIFGPFPTKLPTIPVQSRSKFESRSHARHLEKQTVGPLCALPLWVLRLRWALLINNFSKFKYIVFTRIL